MTIRGYVPVATLDPTEMMRGEEALPPRGGVTGFVPKPATAPLGNPASPKLTGELKLSIDAIIRVVVAAVPCGTFSVDGETEIEKSLVANGTIPYERPWPCVRTESARNTVMNSANCRRDFKAQVNS